MVVTFLALLELIRLRRAARDRRSSPFGEIEIETVPEPVPAPRPRPAAEPPAERPRTRAGTVPVPPEPA